MCFQSLLHASPKLRASGLSLPLHPGWEGTTQNPSDQTLSGGCGQSRGLVGGELGSSDTDCPGSQPERIDSFGAEALCSRADGPSRQQERRTESGPPALLQPHKLLLRRHLLVERFLPSPRGGARPVVWSVGLERPRVCVPHAQYCVPFAHPSAQCGALRGGRPEELASQHGRGRSTHAWAAEAVPGSPPHNSDPGADIGVL